MPGPETYYDRVLGGLVGSAIGDAMGASTEMWYRKDIQLEIRLHYRTYPGCPSGIP